MRAIVKEDPNALHEAQRFGRFQVATFIGVLASSIALWSGIGAKKSSLVYVGIGGLAVSVTFDQIGYSHLKKAARIFNRGAKGPAP